MSLFWSKGDERSLDWSDVFGVRRDGTKFVGSDAALRVIPVYAAVSLIADQFAVLPMSVYRGSRDASKPIPLPKFLANPDPKISLFDWRYQLVTSLKLRGNAYGLVLGSSITPASIRWLHPDWVHIDESRPFDPRYYVHGEPESLWSEGGRLVHIREFLQPGSVKGLSPIANFRRIYETADAAQRYGSDWFNNSAIPTGILRNEKSTLKPGQAGEAKGLFMDATRTREPVVLDQHWTWQQVSIAPDEAQFLQTIKATATQIAAIFRVSPEDIGGESGSSRTYSNREMDQELFNVRTLLPLVSRVESAIDELLPSPQFVKFDMDALTRPSLLDRVRAFTEQLRNGTLTLGEARRILDRPELEQIDIDNWQQWYSTTKSQSESDATSVSLAKTEGM